MRHADYWNSPKRTAGWPRTPTRSSCEVCGAAMDVFMGHRKRFCGSRCRKIAWRKERAS